MNALRDLSCQNLVYNRPFLSFIIIRYTMKIFITLVYCQVSQQYKYTERLASVDHAVFGTVCSRK